MEEFTKIVELPDEILAQLLDSALTERGIPHLMRNYYDGAFDGVFQLKDGWGHVEAPAAYREEILAILQELSEEPLDAGDEAV